MITFEYDNKEYKLVTNWDEVTLQQFINFCRIQEKNSIIPLGEEMLQQQLLESLCGAEIGEFDEMNYGQANTLTPYLHQFIEGADAFNNRDFTFGIDSWNINGIEYAYYKSPNDYNLGEVSDIKTYTSNKKNEYDYLADISSIMIRPAIKKVSPAGKEYYQLTKRNSIDVEHNKKVVLNLPLKDVTRVINFFFVGLVNLMSGTKDYTEANQ
jgi:hypothetical protein